jgi:RNA polymerase sigma factor (sigma-70 family)
VCQAQPLSGYFGDSHRIAKNALLRLTDPMRVESRQPVSLPFSSSLPTVDLVTRAATGSRPALEALLARYRPRLARWAAGRLPPHVRGPLETEDLVHETLLAVADRLPALVAPASFPAYLRQALANRLRDLARRSSPAAMPLEAGSEVPDAQPSPAEQLLSEERWERYEQALATLSAREQLAVVGRLEWGLSHRELAHELDLPSADAARMAATRALARLVRQLVP